MKYTVIPVTAFQQNCSLVWDEASRQAALIDPGGDIERILKVVAREAVEVRQLLLTHGHVDHVAGAARLARQLGVPILGPHIEDAFLFEGLDQQCRMFGFPDTAPFLPDRWLAEGERVQVGGLALEVLHCPGHTPGHIVLYQPEARLAFVGDVLFRGSIGRTDFPRGDHDALIASIRSKLWPLGDTVQFVPGHGPMSSFGHERRGNPFVGDAA
jgi:glyoxylase-like metal-dependent hydrolase (beta-lactamase superfamily II)